MTPARNGNKHANSDQSNKSTRLQFSTSIEDTADACTYVDFENKYEVLKKGYCDAIKPYICQDKADFEVVDVAVYGAYNDEMTWTNDIYWPGDVIPTDGLEEDVFEVRDREELLSSQIHVLFCILSAAGIIISVSLVMLTTFNLATRLKNVSSRNWNQILLIGFVLLLASIPLTKSELSPSLSDEINLLLCQSKLYVRSIGYVLVVSTMVARTWKTYNLYVIKAKKVIMDWRIYLFIATSLFVDGVCLFAKHQFFPHHITEITLETKQIPLNESLIYHRNFVKICAPEDSLKSTLVLLWDKLCLLMAGSYLAYEIRTVKVGMLDDSKAFAWSIYNLLICSICACLLSYLLRDDSKNLFIFTSSLVLVYCCVTMVMVSVPKLWILLSKQRLQNITVSMETPVDEDNHVNVDSSLEEENLPKTETFRMYNDRYGKIPAALMNEHVQLTRQLDHLRRRLTEINGGYQQD